MSKIRSFSRQSGLSLVETVLSIGVASTIFLLIVGLFTATVQSRVKADSIILVETSGSFVGQTLTESVRNAESIAAPLPGASGSMLTLTSSDPQKNPITYSVSNGVLYVSEGGGEDIALTPNDVEVTGITFSNLTVNGTPGTVQMVLDLRRRTQNNRKEYNYSQTFYATGSLR